MVSTVWTVVIVLAIVTALVFRKNEPITTSKFILGNEKYDLVPTEAPIATSTLLKVISYILTESILATTLIRNILNKNNVVNLRELGSLIHLPTLFHPMRRLSPTEVKHRAAEIATSTSYTSSYDIVIDAIKKESFSSSPSATPRTVSDYYHYYRQPKTATNDKSFLPSTVIARILHQIREWEQAGFVVFSSVDASDVISQALASDARHLSNQTLGVLDGVPVAFKDSMRAKGHVQYDGMKKESFGAADKQTEDDLLIKRFRDEGAIVLGLTVMVELGVSPLGYNSHWKGPVSVFSNYRYSGGSSSGSAVAVASGLVPIAIGFDGGGSIRVPASKSGIHGLAVTFGRISFDGALSTMVKAGPLSASSLDAAIAYLVMAPAQKNHFYSKLYSGDGDLDEQDGFPGERVILQNRREDAGKELADFWSRESHILRLPVPHISGFVSELEEPAQEQPLPLADVRLGVFTAWFNDSQAEVREAAYRALDYLKSRGAEIVEITIPHLGTSSFAHAMTIGSEFASGHEYELYRKPNRVEANTRVVLQVGSVVTALEVAAANKIRAWSFKYVSELFAREKLTAIITPTIGVEVPILSKSAKEVGESNSGLSVQIMKYVFLANFLGLPGYSVPIGFEKPSLLYREGGVQGETESEDLLLPIGLQLIGDHWTEHKLLRLARVIEKEYTNKQRRGTPLHFIDPLQGN